MRGRRQMGTNIRRELDVSRVAETLKVPGIDPRSWVEYGTVASVGGEDGRPDFADPNAIVISEDGIDVDVVLGTSQHPVTCRWGHQFGDFTMVFPIHPGDHVEVVIPGGDLARIPSITKVLAGPHTKLPIEASDRKPIFRNDRALFFAKNVPIELRTAGGARVLLNQDGTVVANGGTRGVARVNDTTKLTMSPTDISALAASMVAAGLVLPGAPSGPPSPVVFNGGAITSSSSSVKAGD